MDQGINIHRAEVSFDYENPADSSLHKYFPDFEIDDELYEIKGKQFLAEDGRWQNPYDHSQDDLYEAKHQCALKNNVHILYYEDYKEALTYFEDIYEPYLEDTEL